MDSFLENVATKASAGHQEPLTAATLSSLQSSLNLHGVKVFSQQALRLWIADMAIGRLKVTTRRKYFSRLHTLWQEQKSVAGQDPFEAEKGNLNFEFRLDNCDAERNFELAERLIELQCQEVGRKDLNLFLYLLYNPSASIDDAAGLKFDADSFGCPQIDEIIEGQRSISQRTRNVFNLGQSKKRPPQILRESAAALQRVAQEAGMKFDDQFSRGDITAIWIAAALKVGIMPAEVRAVVDIVPKGYSSLSFIPKIQLADRRKNEIIRKVADFINNKPTEWFVMKLRVGQTPDTIKKRIGQTTQGVLPSILFYYPTHKIQRQLANGKQVTKIVPYLPGVLFFKIKRHLLPIVMSKIGDLAWCYRYSSSRNSRYCTISRNEMRTFQRWIGEFTPDIEIDLEVRDKLLEEGMPVKINGGGRMVGANAVIESIKNSNGSRTYTLRLTDFLQARWTVEDVDEIFIEPAPSVEAVLNI